MKLRMIIFTTTVVLSVAPITIIIFEIILKFVHILGDGGYRKVLFRKVFDIFLHLFIHLFI